MGQYGVNYTSSGGSSQKATGVDVSSKATGGDGSSGSPYTGWNAGITWASNTCYNFSSGPDGQHGHYSCGTIFLTDLDYVQLIGDPGVVIKYDGTGDGVLIYAFHTTDRNGHVYRDLILDCNGQANGTAIYMCANHRGKIQNIEVRNLTGSSNGIYASFCIIWDCSNFKTTLKSNANTPQNGITLITGSISGDQGNSTEWTISNPVIEGVSGDGIVLISADYNTIIGGTSEANGGVGVNIGASSHSNRIIGIDCEANTGNDFTIAGRNTSLLSVSTSGTISIASGAIGTVLQGIRGNTITIASGALQTLVQNCSYGQFSGTFTNGDPSTKIIGLTNDAVTTLIASIPHSLVATASAPAYVKGAMYFDTTLNKLRVGGASAWETITSV